ncbi:MAG TPA: Asp-tRNA(Asn)/Glu-tRNA(Gln) amidotransferase subunit GatB [Candidatus Saccharimonadia bacterium]|nr:Asp-tRNA(Asn)/Glu-tRNA(Gln) amidotransferase subunit GatB [Candidatus Saccharimonadia bacterium]
MRDDWQAVIGLELHVQLATSSKMFSGASTAYGAEPNTHASLVDVALPGTLPVPNGEAIAMAVRFGLAIDAAIAPVSVFARKNYFYPDLPKGYQISQFDEPIVGNGTLRVPLDDGREIVVPIVRAHLEEDAGKSVHDAFHASTAIDLNRAGVPLLEVVTAPALHSPAEAVATMREVHRLVRWLRICDGNMQEGSFRCDANVSVRRAGDPVLGTRVEIKNVNSFRFVEKAIAYEIERQVRSIESGERVVQETRLYDETQNRTRPMRGKESAHDYRYFPDPDLPPLVLDASLVERERSRLAELPEARRRRYLSQLNLSEYDATQLTSEREPSDYFEATLAALGDPPGNAKLAANWVLGELAAALNADQLDYASSRVGPDALASLLRLALSGAISSVSAKEVFAAMWAGEGTAESIIAERGLGQVSDDAALLAAIDAVLAANPAPVAQARGGDAKVVTWLVGQLMKATRGKANPQRLNELLRSRLES